ncbi:MAG: CBS domain-containing protein, partial [Candidatus Methylomirabilales bacterium]
MRPIPPVLAPQRLRRLPRRQQELVEAAAVLGERRGLSVYLVGGPVRDLMLGSPGADLDITVVGNAVPYAKALAASLGARVTIHPRFGTATLILQDGLRLDVATARRERYRHPAALPQVFPATIDEDLFRRDFTINAMAVRLASGGGELLDPFGGLTDLK